MLSKAFMQYLAGSEKPEKDKSKEFSSDMNTKPLFYLILKSGVETKKA